MNINKLPLKLFAGLIILSFFASCNSGNKVVSSFGKRKYTKGYFFNAPQSNKVVARQSKSTAVQPVAVTKNTLPEKALQPTIIQPSIQEKESVNIKHSSQNNTLKHSPTDFPDTLKEKKGTSSNIHIYVNTDANKRSKQLDADAAERQRFLGQWRGEPQCIAAPDVFGQVAEDDAERNGRHDPARLGLRLDGLADAQPFDHGSLQGAESEHHRDHQEEGPQVADRQSDQVVDCREADQRAQHQRLALAEVQRLRGGEGQLIAEGDDAVDHADGNAADDQLQEDGHGKLTLNEEAVMIRKMAADIARAGGAG